MAMRRISTSTPVSGSPFHVATAFEHAGPVRRPGQPLRLPPAYVQPSGAHARRDDDPRLLPPRGSSRSSRPTPTSPTTSPSAPPTGTPTFRMRQPSTTESTRPLFTFRAERRRVFAVPRPHPPGQGHTPGGRGRPEDRRPARSRRIVHDEAYFHDAVRPHVDGRLVHVRRVGRSRGAERAPGRGTRPPAPGRVRGAVRTVRGGSAGYRDAGHRPPARFHARAGAATGGPGSSSGMSTRRWPR
jgi:hypothetical protein